MKASLIIIMALYVSVNILNTKPGNKLRILFDKTFPTAENVKWEDDANGFIVFFKMNGITNRIRYDNKEKFIEQERYYDADNLPAYILIAVKDKYPDKNICGVTELINASTMYYQINLKNDKELYIIKVLADGTIQLEKSFVNADSN